MRQRLRHSIRLFVLAVIVFGFGGPLHGRQALPGPIAPPAPETVPPTQRPAADPGSQPSERKASPARRRAHTAQEGPYVFSGTAYGVEMFVGGIALLFVIGYAIYGKLLKTMARNAKNKRIIRNEVVSWSGREYRRSRSRRG